METKFNFKSQVCTSVEQSRRLLELGLKKETADCMHNHCWTSEDGIVDDIPAWSLGRLVEMMPNSIHNKRIMIYHGAYYVPIDFIKVRKLWDCGKQVETICIEPKMLKVRSC